MIEANLRSYWEGGGRDEELAQEIILEALGQPPADVKTAARALQVMRRTPLHAEFQRQVDEFAAAVELLRTRLVQLAQLGNPETPPEALVQLLGDEGEALNLEGFDANALRTARGRRAGSTAAAAAAFLDAFGWDQLPESAQAGLGQALEYLRGQEGFQSQALLVGPGGAGFVLGLRLTLDQSERLRCDDRVDEAMLTVAQTALHALPGLGEAGGQFGLEWQLPFEGRSLGLAVAVAALVAAHKLPPDPLLAATGEVAVGGAVQPVEGIAEKLRAAADSGMRRVLLPEGNKREAEATGAAAELELLFVSEVAEIIPALSRAQPGTQLDALGRQAVVRGFARQYGFDVREQPVAHGYQFKLSNLDGTATVTLYDSGKRPVGGNAKVKAAAEAFLDAVLPQVEAEPRENIKLMLADPERRARLLKALLAHQAREVEAREHESWRVKLERGPSSATVIQYDSGTLMLQGSAPAHDELRAVLNEEAGDLGGGDALSAPPALEAVRARRAQTADEPWVGTDESGKGDFFGPLVSAAVYVTPETADRLKEIGVADSKKLSDKRVRALAPEVRRIVGKGEYVTAINPPRFNTLYQQMRQRGGSLNTMLAWGHTRSIENLLLKGLRPRYAIVDQFADTRFIEEGLLREAREAALEVHQFPKAEMDIAVAAASVLAREAFIEWLAKTSAAVGLELPKGAGPQVVEAAKALVAQVGPDKLGDYAKLSFRTTEQVLAA